MAGISQNRYLRCKVTRYFLIKGDGVGPASVGLGVVDLNRASDVLLVMARENMMVKNGVSMVLLCKF